MPTTRASKTERAIRSGAAQRHLANKSAAASYNRELSSMANHNRTITRPTFFNGKRSRAAAA